LKLVYGSGTIQNFYKCVVRRSVPMVHTETFYMMRGCIEFLRAVNLLWP